MEIKSLIIKNKQKKDPLAVSSVGDFEFSEGESVDESVLLKDPSVSLYCLDFPNQRAIFVRTASEVKLSQAAFYYQAQYEAAQGLYSVPLKVLHRLAEEISLDDEKIIFNYSVGRCGSTLLSQCFNKVPGLVSLSEPAVFTQLAEKYEWDGSNSFEIGELLKACLHFLCKPDLAIHSTQFHAVKFRSFEIEIANLLHLKFPKAKNIFLYRNAETWLESFIRSYGNATQTTPEEEIAIMMSLTRLVPALARYFATEASPPSLAQVGILMWVSAMERYYKLHKEKVPLLAIRYEDLSQNPKSTIQEIMKYCGITDFELHEVLTALEADSQAGTILSRENLGKKQTVLSALYKKEMEKILKDHSIIQNPDYLLPGTFRP